MLDTRLTMPTASGEGLPVFDHISLLHGFVPVVVDVGAIALVAVVALALRRHPWRAAVAMTAAIAAVATYSYVVNLPAQFRGRFPTSFFLWAAAPIALAIAVAWCWRHLATWPRVAAVVAVPFLVMSAAEQVNRFYGYVPTIGDLVGAPLPGQVDLGRVMSMVEPRWAPGFRAAAARVPTSGVLIGVQNPAPASRFRHRGTYVWLPPAWFEHPRPKLPAVMLLEGSPGSPANWLRVVRAMDVANDWARHHDGNTPIMVIPDSNGAFLADSECVDGSAGRAETYLTHDVVRWADRMFRVDRWAVAGLSEGGTCAVDLALRHPRLFGVFADLSGDLYPNLGPPARTIHLLYRGDRRTWFAHDPMHLMASARYTDLARVVRGRSERR